MSKVNYSVLYKALTQIIVPALSFMFFPSGNL